MYPRIKALKKGDCFGLLIDRSFPNQSPLTHSRLCLRVPCLSLPLNLWNWFCIVFWKMIFLIALCSMWFFWIRPPHPCFCHLYTSSPLTSLISAFFLPLVLKTFVNSPPQLPGSRLSFPADHRGTALLTPYNLSLLTSL